MSKANAQTKRVFISYSHDSQDHKDWVRGLGEYLTHNGIEVLLDQWDVAFGDDLAAFMEKGIRKTDRVIMVCTDAYIGKANNGTGGVGYEKTIATAEILRDAENRRKFIPVVRDVAGKEKMPIFFGAALYLDLSGENDDDERREELLRDIYEVAPSRPPLGVSPFIPQQAPQETEDAAPAEPPSLNGEEPIVAFSDRFSQAFPGGRGTQWFDDPEIIAERLGILLAQPLKFREGQLAGWWRGPRNLRINNFRQVEGSHFLMDVHELNISRIAAVHQEVYYRKFVYVEVAPDEPTGLYDDPDEMIARQIERSGFANEEYGLVDGKLPVTREEYDDGAAIIEGRPVDIVGRCALRLRHTSPYNFIIAPFMSPINNNKFDYELEEFLNRLLQGDDVFDPMCEAINRLPKREI